MSVKQFLKSVINIIYKRSYFSTLIAFPIQALVVVFGAAVALAEAEAGYGGYGGYGGYRGGFGGYRGYGGYGGYRGKREAEATAVAAPEADAEAEAYR